MSKRPAESTAANKSKRASQMEKADVVKVPVTIVTGFLGSGKTTFINTILNDSSHKLKIAVIENEFGEIGIDDALLSVQTAENVVEMNNGCICCTVRGDLIRVLKKFLERPVMFDHIIIETTGLADPAPVAQTFFVDDDIQESYRLDAILTIVDSKHIAQHLDETKPEGVENESVEQIAFADVIMLNKTDLVSAEQLASVKAKIKAINTYSAVFETRFSIVPLRDVLGISAFDLTRVVEMDAAFLDVDGEHKHDESVTSVGIKCTGAMHPQTFKSWLSELLQEKGTDIFRSKGVICLEGVANKCAFQGVHMLCDMAELEAEWGADEERVNQLVFIGRNLDRASLEAGVTACLTTVEQ